MWTISDLKNKAMTQLKANYWPSVGMAFIMAFLTASGGGGGGSAGASSGSGSPDLRDIENHWEEYLVIFLAMMVVFLLVFACSMAFYSFLLAPASIGCYKWFTNSTFERQAFDLHDIGMAFQKGVYMNVVKVMFLRQLYIGLWCLIPIAGWVIAIIKGYEYRMIPYLLAQNPNMSSQDAFAKTKEMMDGEKGNTFLLDLSFIGWSILSLFTCGLLSIFFVAPYMKLAQANLFVALCPKGNVQLGYLYGNGAPYYNGAYDQNNMYGQNGSYNQNNYYGQNGTYGQNNAYGQNGGYNQNNYYGQNGTYGQNNAYGQNGGYNQNNYYGQNGTYGQNNVYGQNGGYNQNNYYGQNGTYGQNNAYDQNGSYNQNNIYTQNGDNNQSDIYSQNGLSNPYNGNVQNVGSSQGNTNPANDNMTTLFQNDGDGDLNN
ncbi:MAG: DUF975 family protein [Lachnospiraceae bacterium]